MAVFTFPFPYQASGLAVTVKNSAGDTVDSGILPERVRGSRLNLEYSSVLPVSGGEYVASVASSLLGEFEVQGQIDVPESLDSTAGVGAAETAFFVATGPTFATDGNGGGHLDFVADDRHGAMPAWASVVDGDPTLSDDAGTVAINAAATLTMDFSAASAIPGVDGGIGVGGLVISNNDDEVINASENSATPGDGEDVQEPNPLRGFGTTGPGTLTVDVFPLASEVVDDLGTLIPDGTATPRVALTITRIAQAAVLPA